MIAFETYISKETTPFYNSFELIPLDRMDSPFDSYFKANILDPDGEIKIKLKLDTPEFCKRKFDEGVI